MGKLNIKPGSTDVTVPVSINDSSSTIGAKLTGLVYNAAGLECHYTRTRGNATILSLATLAAPDSAHSDGGFIEVSDTKAPGLYRLDLPDAVCAPGARSVVVTLKGATDMVQVDLEIDLASEMSVEAWRGVTTPLPALTTGGVVALPSGTVAAMPSQDISSLTTTQIAALTTNTVGAMPSQQISTITTADIQTLTTAQVGAMTSAQFNAITSAQINALVSAQLAAYTADIDSTITGNFTIQQIDAVTEIIRRVTSETLDVLSASNLDGGGAVTATTSRALVAGEYIIIKSKSINLSGAEVTLGTFDVTGWTKDAGWTDTSTTGGQRYLLVDADVATDVVVTFSCPVSINGLSTGTLGAIFGVPVGGFYGTIDINGRARGAYRASKVVSAASTGVAEIEVTVTDVGTTLPIANARVWASTDSGSTNVVAAETTDAFGVVLLYLDPGTYYFWTQKSGYSFTNPDTVVVTVSASEAITGTAITGSGTTVQDIIEDAYELSGIIGDGDTPTAAQLAVGLSRYNSMMQSIGVASNRTWLRKTVSVAMANATSSYDISAAPVSTSRPIRIIGAYIRSGTTDTPLYRISKQEYFEITNKATAGVPTMYWYDADAPTGALYVYPVPATASLPLTVYLDIVHQYEDAQLADTFDAPAVWKEAAIYQLTLRLCARYGREVDPDLTAAAKLALAIAQGQDYMENLPMTEPATRGM